MFMLQLSLVGCFKDWEDNCEFKKKIDSKGNINTTCLKQELLHRNTQTSSRQMLVSPVFLTAQVFSSLLILQQTTMPKKSLRT